MRLLGYTEISRISPPLPMRKADTLKIRPIWHKAARYPQKAPTIRLEEPGVIGGAKAGRDGRLAQNGNVRPANKVAEEGQAGRKFRLAAARPQRRRQESAREENVAARAQKRRHKGNQEEYVTARAQMRRQEGAREAKVAALSQKRCLGGGVGGVVGWVGGPRGKCIDTVAEASPGGIRAPNRRREGAREEDVSVRAHRLRQDGASAEADATRSLGSRQCGTREEDAVVMAQKRRQEGKSEADVSGRARKRRQDSAHGPGAAARPEMRRRQVTGAK